MEAESRGCNSWLWVAILNPEFSDWRRQDQLFVSWLLASVTEGVLARVVGCDFAFEIWEKIKIHFASQTRAKIKQFKTQLRTTRKGSLRMYEYLLKIKIDYSLAAVGSPVPASDYIEAILDGLPDEYESVVTTVISKVESYTVDEIEALLLSQENRLEKKVQLQILEASKIEANSSITANIAQTENVGGRDPNGGSNGIFFKR